MVDVVGYVHDHGGKASAVHVRRQDRIRLRQAPQDPRPAERFRRRALSGRLPVAEDCAGTLRPFHRRSRIEALPA
jgi:hypothetical protein